MTNQIGWIEEHPGASGARTSIRRLRFGLAVLSLLFATPASASGGLVLAPDIPIYVSLLVAFVILIAPLNAMIFRPLFRVLDERDARIDGARSRAGQLAQEADELTERYRDEIRQARDESETQRKEQLEEARAEQGAITAEAKAEAESEVARAREEINSSLAQARETLRASSQDLANVAAERILGRAL